MNIETIKLLLLISGTAVAFGVLHWLIGVAQRRAVDRFALPETPETDAPPSLRRLLFDWGGKSLRILLWVIYLAVLIIVLPTTRMKFEIAGASLQGKRDNLLNWLLDHGINLIIVAVITVFLMRFASALIKTGFHLFELGARSGEESATRRRLQTLSTIFRGIVQSVIAFIGLMYFLSELGANITPILASAGVVGIAVGLGAQSLIKDFFAGFLMLLEDQFNVGDTVKIGDVSGTVERMTLRVTRVRALDGSLVTIPNGSIGTVANYSKDWSRAVLDVEVDRDEDVDRAMQLMLETAKQMREEKPLEIIEDPTMLGVDKVSSTAVTIRLLVKTAANKHADVGRELRRLIKLAFDKEGIKTPTAQQQLVLTSSVEERVKG